MNTLTALIKLRNELDAIIKPLQDIEKLSPSLKTFSGTEETMAKTMELAKEQLKFPKTDKSIHSDLMSKLYAMAEKEQSNYLYASTNQSESVNVQREIDRIADLIEAALNLAQDKLNEADNLMTRK